MKEKPTRLKRRIDPDNPLTEHRNFRLSRAMLDAINRWRGSQAIGATRR